MSLKKRGEYWHISFTTPDGKRIRQSAKTGDKQKAQEFLDRLKAEYWRVQKVGDKPNMSWREAVVRYMRESSNKSRKDDISLFRILDEYLGEISLHQIDNHIIQKIINGRAKDGVGNATINRSLEKVRAILNLAHDDWKVFCDPPKIRLLPEAKKRVRWITRSEANRLLKELPDHLSWMAEFSLETGLRKTNVTGLEWSQIDLSRRVLTVEVEQVLKSDKAFSIPLSDRATEIIVAQIGKNRQYVFTYQGEHMKEVNGKAWSKALQRAGIENFRWHDLRHTWATWHVQNGTPLYILQELGNWSSFEMVKRYAHFSVDHLAQFVTNGTKLAQSQNLGEKKPVINIR
jgi:integrase